MNTLEKRKDESTETNSQSHPEHTDANLDSDEYYSCDEDDNFPDPVKSSDLQTMTNDGDEELLTQRKNVAQTPLTSNYMGRKSDKHEDSRTSRGVTALMERKSKEPEDTRRSRGVTASEQTAYLLEKVTHFKRRANEHLAQIYKDIRDFTNSKQTKIFPDLQQEIIMEFGDVPNICKEKHDDVFDDSCPIVITGETSAGKSTFINLLLGVELLPQSALACTSTICRIHNKSEKKILVTGSSKVPQSLPLKNLDLESVRKVLKRYVTIGEPTGSQMDMQKEEEYEFVDIYWPIPSLHENIIIVDTPGISPDHPDLTKRLFQYLPNVLAFIYVLNASNAGGVQSDRILKIQDELMRISKEEKKNVFDPRRAVFICNKWDLIYEDKQEVFSAILKMLKKTWLGFESSRLLKLSARQELKNPVVSNDFKDILSSIENMLPATVEEKFRRHLQWQYIFVDRVLMRLSTRIRNTYRSKEEKQAVIQAITECIDKVRKDQSMLQKTLHEMAEQKCHDICADIFKHLLDKKNFSKMFDWTENDLPDGGSMEDIESAIDVQIRAKVSAEIMSKMKYIEIESLSEFVKSLFELQQHAIGKECGELDRVFQGETDVTFTFDKHETEPLFFYPNRSFTFEEKTVAVVSSPIWVPAVLLVGAVGIIIIPTFMVVKKFTNRRENMNKVAEYKKSRIKYANNRAEKYLLKIPFENLLTQIQNGILKNINERIYMYFSDVIPKRMAAGELLIKNIERDIRPPCEIRNQCHRVEIEIMPIYGRIIVAYTDLFKEKLIPLSEVRTSLIESINVWQAEIRLEELWIPVHVSTITYATGYNDKYAELAEINLLRKVRHQNIVTLYGFSAGDEHPGKSVLVFTELCDKTLKDEIFIGESSWRSRQRYLEDALKGLEYLHHYGIVHKNIRLTTILIKGNEAKLSSCGITGNIARRTIEGVPVVRAPEFYLESSYCGCESDIFQFGIVIWEAWYRKHAFSERDWTLKTTYDDFIKSLVNGERPLFLEPSPQPLLINVAKSCWQSDPNVRPSAERVFNELGKNCIYL